MEDAQNDKAQLPGIGRDGITSGVQSSRWMQTLGRRESPQRALQDCKENASLESVVENSCDRGLHATTAPHERTALRESSKPGPYADRSACRDEFLNRTQQKGSWDQLCAACHARPCHGHASRSSRVARTMVHAERLVDIICTRAPNVMMICCQRINLASIVRPSRARVRGR